MSTVENKNPPLLMIPGATAIHLDFAEKALLDELVRMGRAVVLEGEPV